VLQTGLDPEQEEEEKSEPEERLRSRVLFPEDGEYPEEQECLVLLLKEECDIVRDLFRGISTDERGRLSPNRRGEELSTNGRGDSVRFPIPDSI